MCGPVTCGPKSCSSFYLHASSGHHTHANVGTLRLPPHTHGSGLSGPDGGPTPTVTSVKANADAGVWNGALGLVARRQQQPLSLPDGGCGVTTWRTSWLAIAADFITPRSIRIRHSWGFPSFALAESRHHSLPETPMGQREFLVPNAVNMATTFRDGIPGATALDHLLSRQRGLGSASGRHGGSDYCRRQRYGRPELWRDGPGPLTYRDNYPEFYIGQDINPLTEAVTACSSGVNFGSATRRTGTMLGGGHQGPRRWSDQGTGEIRHRLFCRVLSLERAAHTIELR